MCWGCCGTLSEPLITLIALMGCDVPLPVQALSRAMPFLMRGKGLFGRGFW